MNYLRCARCRQRFYTAATRYRILARCQLCGGRLQRVERPEDRPPRRAPADDRPPLPIARPSLVRAEPGSYPDDAASFPSLLEFVQADLSRLYSRERDFGLRWRDGAAIYRAAWIEDTGELYMVQLGPPSQGGGHVELLAAGAALEDVESSLTGWREAIHDHGSLNWLRDRVRGHLAPAPSPP